MRLITIDELNNNLKEIKEQQIREEKNLLKKMKKHV